MNPDQFLCDINDFDRFAHIEHKNLPPVIEACKTSGLPSESGSEIIGIGISSGYRVTMLMS